MRTRVFACATLAIYLTNAIFTACVPSLEALEGFACAANKTCPPSFSCVENRCMLAKEGGASSSDAPNKATIAVTPTQGLTTTELGGTATFTVTLSAQPTADVAMSIASSDIAEATVSPTSLVFTSSNWNVPQTITATGLYDGLDDGDRAITIDFSAATSTDATFNGVTGPSVSLTNQDKAAIGRVSVSSSGAQGAGHSGGVSEVSITLGIPRISSDARYVAFASDATNFSADTNGQADVFIHDRTTRTTTIVSLAGDVSGNGASTRPVMSADGRYVAFTSAATNFPGNKAGCYLRDVQVSGTLTGALTQIADDPSCTPHDISSDGRYVLYTQRSAADTLLKRFDRQSTSSITLISTGSQDYATMSDDGRWVSFRTSASLDAADTNGKSDTYLIDVNVAAYPAVRTSLHPTSSGSGQLANGADPGNAISADGSYFVFATEDPLTSSDRDTTSDLYVVSRATGRSSTNLVSWMTASGKASRPDISADGRYVAFEFEPTGLPTEVWVYDRVTTALTNQSKTYTDGKPDSHVAFPSISGSGTWLTFAALATNLVPNDTNGKFDVFVAPRR